MNNAEQTKKCAHPACNCKAISGDYCSEQCRNAVGPTECNPVMQTAVDRLQQIGAHARTGVRRTDMNISDAKSVTVPEIALIA